MRKDFAEKDKEALSLHLQKEQALVDIRRSEETIREIKNLN